MVWSATLGSSAASAQARCPRGHDESTHTVTRGQTLSAIAAGAGLRVAELLASNPGLDADALAEGQKLRLCRPRPDAKRPSCGRGRELFEHSVRAGESLPKLALRYATTEQELFKRNPELEGDPTRLRAGARLTVCTEPMRYRASPQCGYRTPLFEHVVIEGEWLAEIASRYGVRKRELLRLNAALRRNPDRLRPGQKLRVCPDIAPRVREQIEHGVRSGETLASVAALYDLHPRQLLRFQRGRLADPNQLRIGQRLIVWRDGGIAPGFADEDEDDDAQLLGGIQLPAGRHYRLKNPKLAWGTPATVRLVQGAVAEYKRRAGKAPDVFIGDLSRKGGGKFPPHKSHRTGEDVDVAYVLQGATGAEPRFVVAHAGNLDVARTWLLLRAFLDTGRVRYVFMDYAVQALLYEHAKRRGTSEAELDELFQYPRSKRRAYGIVRDDPGHDDHFHVRFQ